MENDWAIVIGINQYPNVTGANDLQSAVNDAEDFIKWLVKDDGGAVPDDHIAKLLQKTSEVGGRFKPAKSQFEAFVEDRFLTILPQRPIGRRLYLYFSGHGISPTGQESIRNAALLMANAVMPTPLLHIPGNILAEGMRSSAYFSEVVLFMDCCRDFQKNVIPNHFDFIDPVEIGKQCRLVEAYATSWGSKAREVPLPPNNEIKGVFTYSLLQVLNSGRMKGTVLKQSVKRYLAQLLKDEKRAQEPVIGPDEELDKIAFNEAALPPRTPVTLKGHPAAPPVIEFFPEGSLASQQVALTDWNFDGDGWSGTLEPSLYELRLPRGGSRRFNVYAAVPEEVQL
jgi:uncharacterized caspase-like protein